MRHLQTKNERERGSNNLNFICVVVCVGWGRGDKKDGHREAGSESEKQRERVDSPGRGERAHSPGAEYVQYTASVPHLAWYACVITKEYTSGPWAAGICMAGLRLDSRVPAPPVRPSRTRACACQRSNHNVDITTIAQQSDKTTTIYFIFALTSQGTQIRC